MDKGDSLTTDEGNAYTSSINLSQKSKSRMSPLKCFGVELSPDNMAVAIVYFVQGVLGLARLAVSFYLKDDLHLDPAEVSHIFLLLTDTLHIVICIIFCHA